MRPGRYYEQIYIYFCEYNLNSGNVGMFFQFENSENENKKSFKSPEPIFYSQ